jgi:hypothetical protein
MLTFNETVQSGDGENSAENINNYEISGEGTCPRNIDILKAELSGKDVVLGVSNFSSCTQFYNSISVSVFNVMDLWGNSIENEIEMSFTYTFVPDIIPPEVSENLFQHSTEELQILFNEPVLGGGGDSAADNKSNYTIIGTGSCPDVITINDALLFNNSVFLLTSDFRSCAEGDLITVKVFNVQDLSYNTISSNNQAFLNYIDYIAPEWADGYPSVNVIGLQSANSLVQINEPAIVYWVVLPDGSISPYPEQVRDGLDSNNIPILISGNHIVESNLHTEFEIDNLAENTDYDVYLVAVDQSPKKNIQQNVSVFSIRTK